MSVKPGQNNICGKITGHLADVVTAQRQETTLRLGVGHELRLSEECPGIDIAHDCDR